ncbi:MAG: hypothetical protein HYU80_02635 [Candidatus Blackburnbacteria bacterium]|nr:hypothetical protein [Candidatus Blackburnbacteria bacterium]
MSFWRRLITLLVPAELGLDILAFGALFFLTSVTRQAALNIELVITLLVDVIEAVYLLRVPAVAPGAAGFWTRQRVVRGLIAVGTSVFFTLAALFLTNFRVGLPEFVTFWTLFAVLILITIQDAWTARQIWE